MILSGMQLSKRHPLDHRHSLWISADAREVARPRQDHAAVLLPALHLERQQLGEAPDGFRPELHHQLDAALWWQHPARQLLQAAAAAQGGKGFTVAYGLIN